LGNELNNKTIIVGRKSAIDISNRGGTEELAKYFVRKENAELLSQGKLSIIRLRNLSLEGRYKIILLGVSKIKSIQIFFFASLFARNIKIQFIKTSYKTTFADLCIRFLLRNIFVNALVSDLDNEYFSDFTEGRRINLDIPEIIISNLELKFNSAINISNRKYDIAYVGRIDKSKGFFEALEIMRNKSLNKYSMLMQLLLWETELENKVFRKIKNEDLTENISIKQSSKYNSKMPIYSDIKILLLPYTSFQTTIRIPLVIIEAILHGCLVILPAWVQDDLPLIKIIDKCRNKYPNTGNILFYDDSNNIAEVILKELNEIRV